MDIEVIIPKVGLIIDIFFCISPLPALMTAITNKDKKALNSLSIPAAVMGLSCSTSVLAFCYKSALIDCVMSCCMFIVMGLVQFLVFCAFNRALFTCSIVIGL